MNRTARRLAWVGALVITGEALATSPWQNPAWPADVNDDGRLTPLDALEGVNALNLSGPGPLPAPTPAQTPPPYLDVNGDGLHTPADVLVVINELNGLSPEPPATDAPIEVAFTDAAGLPGTVFSAGDLVRVELRVRDSRATPQGVYASYLDVQYDPSQLALVGSPEPGDALGDVQIWRLQRPGLVRDVGGAGDLAPTAATTTVLAVLTFAVDPSLAFPVTPVVSVTPGSLPTWLYGQEEAAVPSGDACPDADDDGTCDAWDVCLGDDGNGDLNLDGRCDATLSTGRIQPGQPATFEVTGARPGSRFFLLGTARGAGQVCQPRYGVCLSLNAPALVASGVVGGDGTWQATVTVPPALPVGREVRFQGAWLDPVAVEGDVSQVVVRVAE